MSLTGHRLDQRSHIGKRWNIGGGPLSLSLDVRKLHHLAPFLGFVGYELTELGGRAPDRDAAKLSEPRFRHGVGEGHVDLIVELVDDLDGRGPGRAEAMPGTRLITRHYVANCGDVRQSLPSRRS